MTSAIFYAADRLWRLIKKHSPELLTACGITGMISGTVMAIKSTPKALKLIEERKEAEKDKNKLPSLEIVKVTWRCYIPAIVTDLTSIACLVCAQSINNKRHAALTAAYALSETAFKEYKNKVVDVLGERKEQSIRDAIDKDRVNRNPPPENSSLIPGSGTVLCFDTLSSRYFWVKDVEDVKKAVNECDLSMLHETTMSLNEFYDYLDLPHTDLGDLVGWGMADGFIDVGYSSQIAENGHPCLVISHKNLPRADYQERY